ncbi:hypothetical protein VTK26DRAFT_7984 [Humicola hyalothermophila]
MRGRAPWSPGTFRCGGRLEQRGRGRVMDAAPTFPHNSVTNYISTNGVSSSRPSRIRPSRSSDCFRPSTEKWIALSEPVTVTDAIDALRSGKSVLWPWSGEYGGSGLSRQVDFRITRDSLGKASRGEGEKGVQVQKDGKRAKEGQRKKGQRRSWQKRPAKSQCCRVARYLSGCGTGLTSCCASWV